MATEKIGRVTSPVNGKIYDVKMNYSSGEVYVSYAGWSYIGKVKSTNEALNMAQSWLLNNS